MVMTRQFDENDVLEKVLSVFWTRGWLSTSMNDLALATGVQRGSLYHAFESKDRLFRLAFDRYAARVLDESRTALEAPTARAAIQSFLDASIRRMVGDQPARGCFTTKTALEGGALSEETLQRLQDLVTRQQQLLIEALARQEWEDELAVAPETAARLITTLTRGLAVIERVYRDVDHLHAVSQDLVDLLAPVR
ncbi:MAG: TetR/AcrR family transcriptional regulator [Comamonas sp.]